MPQKRRMTQRDHKGAALRLRWRLEAWLAAGCMRLAQGLGPRRASDLGGAVARRAGPWLPVSRIGRRNLELAFPDSAAAWREDVLRQAWENLGRTTLELPLTGLLRRSAEGPGWELQGEAHLPASGPAILVSGHLANWEMLMQVPAQLGLRIGGFYRAPDNPLVDALLRDMRQQALPLFPKGARGARQALRHLAEGLPLGLLVDQKLNEGLELDFLGQPAMTTSAAAELALRFGCPILPVRVERLGPARFRLTVEPPLPPPPSSDRAEATRWLTQAINDRLGAWIRARPGEWLWLHRRFPRSVYQGKGKG